MNREKIGSFLKARREKLKLSQVEVSARIGMTQGTLSKLERGRAELSFDTAILVTKALRLPMRKLVAQARG